MELLGRGLQVIGVLLAAIALLGDCASGCSVYSQTNCFTVGGVVVIAMGLGGFGLIAWGKNLVDTATAREYLKATTELFRRPDTTGSRNLRGMLERVLYPERLWRACLRGSRASRILCLS